VMASSRKSDASPQRLVGADGLARAVALEGADLIFGVLGEANLEFVERVAEEQGVRYIAARHDAAAVGMADGYARASGRPGVCTVTEGAGLTQTCTPLTEARAAGSPLVLVAGDERRGAGSDCREGSRELLALATAGAHRRVGSIDSLAHDVRLAFHYARAQHSPIVLSVPLDIQRAPLPAGWEYVPARFGGQRSQRPAPDPERVAIVADLVRRAKRPLILAGRGAVSTGARDALAALGNKIGAALGTTLLAKDFFRDQPFDIGIVGGFSNPISAKIAASADLVLAFGASLNPWTTARGELFRDATIVQVGIRPDSFDPMVAETILGDARATAIALRDELQNGEALAGLRSDPLWKSLDEFEPFDERDFVREAGSADPREVARVLDECLPHDGPLVIGVGHFEAFPAMHVSVRDPDDLILPWALGATGSALAMGIGAAFARPVATTVAIEGDGSLMMSLGELETAVRVGAPLLLIVMDDRAYGAETYLLENRGLNPRISFFEPVDFVRVAEALGVHAYRAETAEELRVILPTALAGPRPALVQVLVNQSVRDHQGMEAAFESVQFGSNVVHG
jgi:acetolactate synthase I/II/III large subunit